MRKPRYEIIEESKENNKFCEIRPTNCDGNCAYALCNKKEKGRN
jgi:hypothetical protein